MYEQACGKEQCITGEEKADQQATFGEYNQRDTDPAVLDDKIDKFETRNHNLLILTRILRAAQYDKINRVIRQEGYSERHHAETRYTNT